MGQPIVLPNTTIAGGFLRSVGDGQSSSYWSATGNTLRLGATFVSPGILSLASGPTAYNNPLIVPVGTNETVMFVGVAGLLRDGSSVVLSVTQNGVNVTGLTNLTITTSMTRFYLATSIAVADLDQFSPVFTTLNGTPGNLSLMFCFDVTA